MNKNKINWIIWFSKVGVRVPTWKIQLALKNFERSQLANDGS